MGLRLGFGFRRSRHVWLGATAPLGHARRCLAHDGHGTADPVDGVIGAAILWVMACGLWGIVAGNG